MTVSQNNQQNALPNGLGGVSLQTYHYDAMNRLIRSSGDNFDAGVSYNFQQTYSPSGRIGNKFCDFTHSDHLGSSSWTTDEKGYAIQHIEYLPFGEEFVNQRTTSYEDRYTFTGKELDAESNLYYYDARYNSSIEQGIFPSFVGNQIQFKIQSLDEIDSFFIKSISKSIYGLSLYDF